MPEKFSLRHSYKTALFYLALAAGMFLLDFTATQFEPFSLALLYAALVCGISPLAAGLCALAAGTVSLAAGWIPFLVHAAHTVLLSGGFLLFARAGKNPRAASALLLVASLAPYLFLYGNYVYGDLLRAAVFAAAIFLLGCVCAVALRCALFRAFRRKLAPEEPLLCGAAAAAIGIGLYNCAGAAVSEGVSLFLLLLCCALRRKGDAMFCALPLALPAAICESVEAMQLSAGALGFFTLYAAVCLCFLRTGKFPAALAVFFCAVLVHFFEAFAGGSAAFLSAPAFYYGLLAPFLPCALFALLPNALLDAGANRLAQYGERQLTKASINRNRALIGNRLFDAAAAFREIEGALAPQEGEDPVRGAAEGLLLQAVLSEVCAGCDAAGDCAGREEELRRLIGVGCSKGKVNLIDMPAALAAKCRNPSSLLFCLTRQLVEFRRRETEAENAAVGRRLLADQAHALADLLKALALEQSAPVGAFSEAEKKVQDSLARAGIGCDEVFFAQEEVFVTAPESADGEKMRRAAERALGVPLALSEKRMLPGGRACRLFKKRPKLDAAFGVASRTKQGEAACGDTHSVQKIDERTFLFALADGMGSGERARRISDCALSLLESFYRAGMQGELALDTVNRLLALDGEENFACMDAAAVDLDTGRADIVKIGSPLAFLIGEKSVEILESDSLPLGILEGVRPTTLTRTLSDGDVLLFLSDGITAAFGSSADIAEFLGAERANNPQTLAEKLLCAALERAGGTAEDDMTAIAVRLFSAA